MSIPHTLSETCSRVNKKLTPPLHSAGIDRSGNDVHNLCMTTYTNSMIAELLNSPNSDETTNRAIQMHCERLARHIGTAQSRRTPPSTSVPPG